MCEVRKRKVDESLRIQRSYRLSLDQSNQLVACRISLSVYMVGLATSLLLYMFRKFLADKT